MFKTIRMIKIAKEIANLATRLANTESVVEKSFIFMEANGLKSRCAADAIDGKIDFEFYAEAFKVGECNGEHYLKAYLEQVKG